MTEPPTFLPPAGALPGATAPAGDATARSATPATIRARALAWTVDYGLLPMAVFLLVAAVTYLFVGDADAYVDVFVEDGRLQAEDYEWWLVYGLTGMLGWYVVGGALLLGLGRGVTPGRRLAGIRVVRADGGPIGLGYAILRESLAKGVLVVFFFPLVLSYLWPLVDRRRRTFHDVLAGTVVVEDAPPVAAGDDVPEVEPAPPSAPAPPAGPRLPPPPRDAPLWADRRPAGDDPSPSSETRTPTP